MDKLRGTIFNIQKFSVHDGAGVRDVVFFKGCPLRCVWCANPESQEHGPEMAYNMNQCLGTDVCGYCIKACPHAALSKGRGTTVAFDKSACVLCGKCASICPPKARKIFGEEVTVDEVYRRTQSQKATWRVNGGITISGGEPLSQGEFLCALLEKYKAVGIHTAIETCGYAPWNVLKEAAKLCDCIFYDVKLMDPEKHKRYTGVDNVRIIDNLKNLRATYPDQEVIVRTPVIPTINDDEENLTETAKFLKSIGGVTDYELLPYHNLGLPKYQQLEKQYALEQLAVPDKERIKVKNEELRRMIR